MQGGGNYEGLGTWNSVGLLLPVVGGPVRDPASQLPPAPIFKLPAFLKLKNTELCRLSISDSWGNGATQLPPGRRGAASAHMLQVMSLRWGRFRLRVSPQLPPGSDNFRFQILGKMAPNPADTDVSWSRFLGNWDIENRGSGSTVRAGGLSQYRPSCHPGERDWYLIVERPAPASHLANPEGCAALRIVLVTVPHVSHSCELFQDGFDLHLLPPAATREKRRRVSPHASGYESPLGLIQVMSPPSCHPGQTRRVNRAAVEQLRNSGSRDHNLIEEAHRIQVLILRWERFRLRVSPQLPPGSDDFRFQILGEWLRIRRIPT